MEKIRLQDRAELKEFLNTNTKKGVEKRNEVLNRLGLVTETKPVAKYVMRNGIPHKIQDGVWVALTKKA